MLNLSKKSLLQRRANIANSIQAGLDGLAVIMITWLLVVDMIGEFTLEYTVMLLLLLGIMAFIYDQVGIYRSNASFTLKALSIFKAWSISFAILLFIAFASKQSETFSRLVMTQLYLFGLISQILLHTVYGLLLKTWFKHYRKDENVLIIGNGQLADYLALKIQSNPWLGQNVVGALTINENENENENLTVIGDISHLEEVLKEYQLSRVYIVTPLEVSQVLEKIYFMLLDNHISIHWIPDIFSLRLVNHSVSELAGLPVLTLSESPLAGTRLLLKSFEDKLLSLVLLLITSPIFLFLAIAIKLDSPGPVFFRQERAGWGGKTFKIWKFRSMQIHEPDGNQLKQATKNDSRITKVGRFMRKTSLDEIPQFINVLVGDMSLVGPRPHAIQHDEEYSKRITEYFARHQIKPGITGLAQVRGLRGETQDVKQMMQRIESDIEYINNWSIWLDLVILLRTLGVFSGKNAY